MTNTVGIIYLHALGWDSVASAGKVIGGFLFGPIIYLLNRK